MISVNGESSSKAGGQSAQPPMIFGADDRFLVDIQDPAAASGFQFYPAAGGICELHAASGSHPPIRRGRMNCQFFPENR